MNKVTLHGTLKNIKYSHEINGIEYQKADFVVNNSYKEDDILSVRFKKSSNMYQEGSEICIQGNIRSFSKMLDDSKSRVQIYIFTYFDLPETADTNLVQLDGKICKMNELYRSTNGKPVIHFILANNIISEYSKKKINSYIPCTAFGSLAERIAECSVGNQIEITGKIHSRTYTKHISEDEIEYKVAHEVVLDSLEVIE